MTYCNSRNCKRKNKCAIHVFNAPEGHIHIKDISIGKCEYRKETGIRKTTDLSRWKMVKDMRDNKGFTFKAIANELGVSRQRVEYIYKRIKEIDVDLED